MAATTKAELERQLKEAQKALRDKVQFDNSAAQAESGGNYTLVPIRNYGDTLVSLEFEFKGNKKVLLLETTDPKRLGAIPLEVWIELERTSKLVADGYIARTDLPITNPNVLEDDEDFIKSHGEKELADKVNQMTNTHVLLRLLRLVESMGKNKSGKYLSAETALKNRIFEVTETYGKKEDGTPYSLGTGIRVVEEEE